MSSEKRYDYDPETGTVMTPLGNIWYDLDPAADRLNAQAERIAELEAVLMTIRFHPNANFNVAIVPQNRPTIQDICDVALKGENDGR